MYLFKDKIIPVICIMLITTGIFISKNNNESKVDPIDIDYSGYNSPKDLFFCFLKEDKPYITQNVKDHFKSNGYLATDIGTNKQSLNVYAPSYIYLDHDGVEQDIEVEYRVNKKIQNDTTGLTMVLSMISDPDKLLSFDIGHMKTIDVEDGAIVKTGDLLGVSGGCPGSLQFGEKSTGCHVHFEHRISGFITPYPTYMYSNHGNDLVAYKESKTRKPENTLSENDPIYRLYGKNTANDDYELFPYILSAQHLVENDRCISDCGVSLKGARGPMQFMPETWTDYKCDGNDDDVTDMENLHDSMCSAAKYMKYLFEEKGKGQNPDIHVDWQWWKALYIYYAGYPKEFPPTHKDGLPDAVIYADTVLNLAKELRDKHM
jgi:hypothetical protein